MSKPSEDSPNVFSVLVRRRGWVDRMVQVDGRYPESDISHWCHGDRDECVRLGRDEAIMLVARLREMFGADGYSFDLMAERPTPQWVAEGV